MKSKKRIVCFGPGPMFKGGIANYNTSLAKAFDKIENTEVHIVSWTQQYPAIIPRDFIDRKSKVDQLEGTNINVHYITNYNNPLSWKATVKLIKSLNPDKVIFQWAIAIQGIPLGFIAKNLKKESNIEVFFDLHFVIQKEGSALDNRLTRLGIINADSYIVHAFKTAEELKQLFPKRKFEIIKKGDSIEGDGIKVLKLYHPVYDMFKPDSNFDKSKTKKEMGLKENVFLFFGFIRKYKGLHNVIEAFNILSNERDDVSLIICGESFWNTLDKKKLSTRIKNATFGLAKKLFLRNQDNKQDYNPLALIEDYQIDDLVFLNNEFVPNEEVPKYFQVSDTIMLYYLTATPSGVESIGYNFNMPMLATNVGHFPETVIDGYNGYMAEANDIDSMVKAMNKSIENPIDRKNVAATSKDMSWNNYANEILR
ncbi:MAG: glycosyltransferase [Lentimicrobiaceae bacterium]|jgi:glycosyltransferase involved in cell wall biosynthesis|nr:glycosyltransferase [Lentimicrobiaceae bacterium]MBT3455258.1 glycosyltransferase [Lentimicrobiaceae bacterium]MBT4189717.1 glycosyltransferase [Lentimicrobiaceae bacterium]MBT5163582.1 glycosyltransferase [Lentimicrobiaceae bacterium]MBT7316195.1 glycosyltransferase [Lentimicrobiaceae bacterium]